MSSKPKQNFGLRGDRDEMIKHIISEWIKLLENEFVGMVINWELCKKFKLDQTDKWYMHKPESVLENETHKILRDLEIHNPGQKTRPDKK